MKRVAGFQDKVLDKALRKIIDHRIARDQADLQRVNEDLSQEFYQRLEGYNEGADHTPDGG